MITQIRNGRDKLQVSLAGGKIELLDSTSSQREGKSNKGNI